MASLTASSTINSNTPSILNTAGTILASNPARIGFSIQNVGTNPLFVLLGSGASTSVFHYVIKGGSANSDGLGGSISFMGGTVFSGIVSVAGTSPLLVVTEIAP
jgi:hypothetical protein